MANLNRVPGLVEIGSTGVLVARNPRLKRDEIQLFLGENNYRLLEGPDILGRILRDSKLKELLRGETLDIKEMKLPDPGVLTYTIGMDGRLTAGGGDSERTVLFFSANPFQLGVYRYIPTLTGSFRYSLSAHTEFDHRTMIACVPKEEPAKPFDIMESIRQVAEEFRAFRPGDQAA